ncbi:transglycosylase SLT domain-containing protein [Streptomyces sp. A3M-1-3]|uniref:transglycosylase SLT domain-containing protein n=1 Tax=Streptomyces sp. A3M-1-3 TaxID=2962044 RepID=UPI0020B85410|nr:transglycosylase SLT domain-containing protein [Streptomyces sp. A3M-1-3]MCP3821243.1 transglycosylase SLT domain-containing protein [Streptomyces sp. A3M-1-3]
MSESRISGLSRLTKKHKLSIAGVAAVSAAALGFTLVPASASAAHTEPAALSAAAAPVAWTSAKTSLQAETVHKNLTKQHVAANLQAKAAKAAADKAAAQAKAEAAAKAKALAEAKAKAAAKAKAEAAAKKRAKEQAASRAAARKPVYANNLDGWIREAMSIMKKEGIPGSYEGIHRNIIRESSGNPRAINNWDINAINGIPSKGLLQVIQPTFDTYHVKGTKKDLYDPVANIVAACNYAADRYGSMDNVNGAY